MVRRTFGTTEPRYNRSDIAAWKRGERKSKPKPIAWRARYWDPRSNDPRHRERISAPTTFETKAAAEAWLAGVQADVERGTWKHPDEVAAEEEARRLADIEAAVPFATYAESWLATRPLKKSTHDAYRSYLDHHLIPRWGDTPVRDISTPSIRAWLATDLAPGHPGARRKAFELFKTILATAVDDDLIPYSPIKRNMLGKAPRSGETSQRHQPRALTPAEIEAVVDELPEYMRALTLLTAVTGMRAGEVRELRRRDVDLEAGTITVSRSVTGQGKAQTVGTPKTAAGARTIHLSAQTVDMLRHHLATSPVRGKDALVFASSTDPSKAVPIRTWQINLARACKRAGVEHASPHDLRHSAASLAGRVPDMSLRDIQAMLGQSTPGMAATYMHSGVEQQRKIADALAAQVLGTSRDGSVVEIPQQSHSRAQ